MPVLLADNFFLLLCWFTSNAFVFFSVTRDTNLYLLEAFCFYRQRLFVTTWKRNLWILALNVVFVLVLYGVLSLFCPLHPLSPYHIAFLLLLTWNLLCMMNLVTQLHSALAAVFMTTALWFWIPAGFIFMILRFHIHLDHYCRPFSLVLLITGILLFRQLLKQYKSGDL